MRPSSIVGRCATFGAALFALAACHGSASNTADTVSASGALAPPAPSPDSASAASATPSMVRGAVTAVSSTSLQVATPNGTDTVALTPPVQVYDRESSSLANVKQNTFIGVTTVKQPDGSERATEIHIFPEALRGLGEGSRMMTQPSGAASGSRMTNGAVNSTPSRMSNGSVSSTNGSTLVVQYAGGSTTVTVPPNTPVMEIKQVSRPLAVGDSVVVLTSKSSDGTVTSNRVMLMGKR